ncbi:unnamed protein product [Thlaspi arvense]|uniref:Uncharacterized protein n=1 Tax=Thlaspi arvense TaxID=13288 RepID=A0AAU9RAN0_THLAR|nr:unnamed protein product [Thlaspi arvense]
MERQFVDVSSRKAQREEMKEEEEESVDKEEYLAGKQVSVESDELEKSCLTEEEEEDEYLSDQNSRKRTREADTTCEPNKIPKLNNPPRQESDPCDALLLDDWLFGTVNQQKKPAAIKNDVEDMKLQISGSPFVYFPRAQFLSQVGIFALPYTVLF